jgi:hypothetical protein
MPQIDEATSKRRAFEVYGLLYLDATRRPAFKHMPDPPLALTPPQSFVDALRQMTIPQRKTAKDYLATEDKTLFDFATAVWSGKAQLSALRSIVPVHLKAIEDALVADGLGKRDSTGLFHVRQLLIFHQ